MTKTFILVIVTTIFWGTTPILEKIALTKSTPLIGVTIRSVAVAVFMVLYLLASSNIDNIATINLKSVMIFSISGILAGGLGMLTYFGALKAGATSKIVPIVAAYPLVTALLSVIILGEGVTLPRVIGTLFIISGVYLVK